MQVAILPFLALLRVQGHLILLPQQLHLQLIFVQVQRLQSLLRVIQLDLVFPTIGKPHWMVQAGQVLQLEMPLYTLQLIITSGDIKQLVRIQDCHRILILLLSQLLLATAGSDVTQCGTATASLSATTNMGSVEWYAASSGGTVLSTGDSYSPSVSSTTTYYVASSNCQGTRSAITVTVNDIPSPSASSSSAAVCAGNTIDLTSGLTASTGSQTFTASGTQSDGGVMNGLGGYIEVTTSSLPTGAVVTGINLHNSCWFFKFL